MAFRRIVNVPKRNMGPKRMQFLETIAREQGITLYEALTSHMDDPIFKGTRASDFVELIETFSKDREGKPVSEILSALLDESGYEEMMRTVGSQERLDNLAELKQSVFEYEMTAGEETGIADYLAHAALFSNLDTSPSEDKVKLMTIHTAKGLEFPYVFLCGMNEGIFPSRKTRTRQAMEEERRLAFVALTRAEKGLYLSEAGGWGIDGAPRYPSRFVFDIDPDTLFYDPPLTDEYKAESLSYIERMEEGLREMRLPGFDSRQAIASAIASLAKALWKRYRKPSSPIPFILMA